MTREDEISDHFHKNRGVWFCDHCIAKRFNLGHPHARTIAATLGALGVLGQPFERQPGVCSVCQSGDRLVTRWR
jgi:hypothetical protein